MSNPPVDKIYIRDLHVRCIVGIYPEERTEKQDVVINMVLHTDLRDAGKSDDIEDTVNYKTIKKQVLKMVQESEYLLIEKLADEVALIALSDPKVELANVTIDKPGALRFARSVAVEITRTRSDETR
jgi:D-erythro-7,8-dihydroneopterin triphosphate epimerase